MSLDILIVIPNDSLGGAEQHLKMIAKYYANNKTRIKIVFLRNSISNGWDELKRNPNIKFYYPTSTLELIGVCFLIKNAIRFNCKFDYVYSSHVKVTSLLGCLMTLTILKCKQFVARESTSIFKRYTGVKLTAYKLMYQLGYSKVNLLICQTDYMKTQLLDNLPNLREKVVTISNPIDFDIIQSEGEKLIATSEKEKLGNYIVSAGRLIPEKGFDLLIKAYRKLLTNTESDIKLLILGEGKERKKLEELIIKQELEGKVILKGFVDNVYPYFKEAKICVVSSRIEGFPNVLLQMMSQNNNVVSTLCAGKIDEIPGVITCKTEDEYSLYEALILALNNKRCDNKIIFNEYLSEHTITKFVKTIEHRLR